MSVRQGLLTLLRPGPKYGFQLRAEFESRTGVTWPLNIGQVYTTLGRLERDGLVEVGDEDADRHVYYWLTSAGRAEVTRWLETPVDRTAPSRDELAIKLALVATVPEVDVRAIVHAQRAHSLQVLQDHTQLRTQALQGNDIAWQLVVDSLVCHAEAELRWLDHCESRLASHTVTTPPLPARPR